MKKPLPLLFFLLPVFSFAQRSIQMKNIWERPQVHVQFEGYTVSFTIRDINRALVLLAEAGDSSYGKTCGLDPGGDYTIELTSGTRMEYTKPLEPLIQNGVGVFLINAGHAYIQNPRNKRMTTILSDRHTFQRGMDESFYIFYDPGNHQRLFAGKMIPEMKDKDLGIDY